MYLPFSIRSLTEDKLMFLTLKYNCETTTDFEDDMAQVWVVVKIECMLNNVWINLVTSLFVEQVISGHLGWVRCIAVEPGNQWFVTGSADRTIKVIRRMLGVFRKLLPREVVLMQQNLPSKVVTMPV